MRRLLLWSFLVAVFFPATGCGQSPPASQPGQKVYQLNGHEFAVEAVATGLTVPWSLAWMPGGQMLVTQRPGRLSLVEPGGKAREISGLPKVDVKGEHGLMGMALSPTFEKDRLIFLSLTGPSPDSSRVNRIIRCRLSEDYRLTDLAVLIDNLPAEDYHDGLPLHFGPDGMLYASTGDAGRGKLAQQQTSLAGKFLRIAPDGSVPPDNPLPGSPIWTLGNRNCQGFDWSPATGELYATEHGPSVPVDSAVGGGDELNRIVKSGNYGWPIYHHDENKPPFIAPLKTWTPAIAPAGAAFYRGDVFPNWRNLFFFAALRGEALWCVELDPADPSKIRSAQRLMHREFGRLRAVAMGPDGLLYITTSNRDGRGKAAAGDDKVLRLVPVNNKPTTAPGR